MKLNWKIALFLMACGCAAVKNQSRYNVNLQSFECMGDCPVYHAKIDSLRNLTFEGTKNAKVGVLTYKISRSEYSSLTEAVDELIQNGATESLEVGSLDANSKEIEITAGNLRKVYAVNRNKPRTIKLDSIMNEILSSRGLID